MLNILRALKRDLIRLVKSPSALIVMVAILILPSAYTWYNVEAFWDPYGNTSNMRVAVVNDDLGSSSELTGEMNVGDELVDALNENTQLGWEFMDFDTAVQQLNTGEVYAIYVIPEDFTKNLLSIASTNYTKPEIKYYVNEKLGPVAPKITDKGSTALEEKINSTFVETVSDVALKALTSFEGDVETSASGIKSNALQRIDEAISMLDDGRNLLSHVDTKLAKLQSLRGTTLDALDAASAELDSTSGKLGEVSTLANTVQDDLIEVTPQISQSMTDAIDQLAELEAVASALGYGDEVKDAIDKLRVCSTTLNAEALPTVTRSVGRISTSFGSLSAAVAVQESTIAQTRTTLDQLDVVVTNARTALGKTSDLLDTAKGDLTSLHNDLTTLSMSTLISDLFSNIDEVDAGAIASFLGSPTTIRTEQLYPLSSYGAAMAPLFMNLTFWIGAFMFLIVFRQEADDEGIENFSVGQRYISRFLFFSVPAILQAVVCDIGLLALGVQVEVVPALFVASMMASWAYLSIIYALSIVLQHIGKGLCIVLVFLQIPAATGLYPIEMTASFYQTISPLFPFTYGIGALREAICGFYGTQFFENIGALAVFFVLFLVLGIVLRPLSSNVNRLVAREISDSGLMNGERVDVPERKYKINQVMSALTDRAGYHDELQNRYDNFQRNYPLMIKAALIASAAVPVVIGIICALAGVDRVITLTLWLIWLIVVILVFVGLETFRNGFRNQFALSGLSDEELFGVVGRRNTMLRTDRHNPAHPREAFKFWNVFDLAEEAAEDLKQSGEHAQSTSDGDDRLAADTPVAHDEAKGSSHHPAGATESDDARSEEGGHHA